MSGWRMSPVPSAWAELARFLENSGRSALSGGQLAGGPYRQWPALSPLSFLAALRERAGPVTWVMMIACVVFIVMQILGDQK